MGANARITLARIEAIEKVLLRIPKIDGLSPIP
jgi:hypothetical protein